jgi:hypothetical protein
MRTDASGWGGQIVRVASGTGPPRSSIGRRARDAAAVPVVKPANHLHHARTQRSAPSRPSLMVLQEPCPGADAQSGRVGRIVRVGCPRAGGPPWERAKAAGAHCQGPAPAGGRRAESGATGRLRDGDRVEKSPDWMTGRSSVVLRKVRAWRRGLTRRGRPSCSHAGVDGAGVGDRRTSPLLSYQQILGPLVRQARQIRKLSRASYCGCSCTACSELTATRW